MSVFSRILKIGQAQANRLVDKLEKPEVMLEQAIRDRSNQLGEARAAVVKVIASEKETRLQLDQLLRQHQEWEERAEMALSAGKEDLAAKALTRAEELGANIEALQRLLQNQQQQSQQLKSGLQKMEGELDELKRNKNIILAQAKAADARKSISQARAKIGKNDTSELLDRIRNKARESMMEASAMEELAENSGDPLEKEFSNLGTNKISNSVQQRLEAMKQRRLDHSKE